MRMGRGNGADQEDDGGSHNIDGLGEMLTGKCPVSGDFQGRMMSQWWEILG